jgi:hypothetical protein
MNIQQGVAMVGTAAPPRIHRLFGPGSSLPQDFIQIEALPTQELGVK